MKKVITLALAAMVVVLGLASCNKKDGDKDAATTPATTTTAAEITTAADTTTEAVTTEADTTADSETLEGGFETSVEGDNIVYKSDRFSFTYEAKYDDSAAAADGMFGISDASGSTFLININEYGESKESDRASFKNDLETAFKSMDENFKFTKYEDTKIDGVDAVVADYTLMGINVHSVCVFADDALYNITLTAADMQSTFAKDMLKTIDSFTLN